VLLTRLSELATEVVFLDFEYAFFSFYGLCHAIELRWSWHFGNHCQLTVNRDGSRRSLIDKIAELLALNVDVAHLLHFLEDLLSLFKIFRNFLLFLALLSLVGDPSIDFNRNI
jgi:hypothetical protein